MEECTDVPRISEISSAVAEALPSRKKKKAGVSQFHEYSDEWKRVRDAKIEETRKQIH
jgi:hypothetical protein